MSVSHVQVFLTPPQGGTAWPVPPAVISFEGEINEATTAALTFLTNWDIFNAEADDRNPLQLNSYCELKRYGRVEWRGKVVERHCLQDAEGERLVQIDLIDLLGSLQDTLASWTLDSGTQYLPTVATPALEIAQIDLYRLDAIGDAEYVYAPNHGNTADPASSSPWLTNANVNSVAVNQGSFTGVSPADGASIKGPAITDTGAFAMLPSGIIRITTAGNTECIQYDGYMERSDGYFYFNNIKRGVLNASAIAHNVGDTAYQVVSKHVNPTIPAELFGTDATPEENSVPNQHYQLNVDDGYVYFAGNPGPLSGDPDLPYTSFDLAYGVYDETNTADWPTGRLTLADVVFGLMGQSAVLGGPAFGPTTSVSFSPDIPLTRVQFRDTESTLGAIQRIYEEIGLNKGSTIDALIAVDDPSGSLDFGTISQKASSVAADHYFDSARSIAQSLSIEDIYGAVLVKYKEPVRRNLLTAANTWFSDFTGSGSGHVDTTIGSNNKAPDGYVIKPASTTDGGWSNPAAVPELQNNLGASRIFDGDVNSGFGLAWPEANNPGSDCEILFSHFTDAAGAVRTAHVDKVSLTVDLTAFSSSTNPVTIRVYGLTGFTPGTTSARPTYTSRFNISAQLIQKYAVKTGETEATTSGAAQVTLTAEHIGIDCEALVVVFDGLPQSLDTPPYRMARFVDFQAYENETRTVLVSLTNSEVSTLDNTYIYAPDSYAKTLDANTGMPRVKVVELGVVSRNAAISLGRLALLQALALSETKEFIITGEFRRVPIFGDTCEMPGGWRGVCIGKEYTCSAEGAESLTLRLVNFNNALFGG